jgi:hypothetical protein
MDKKTREKIKAAQYRSLKKMFGSSIGRSSSDIAAELGGLDPEVVAKVRQKHAQRVFELVDACFPKFSKELKRRRRNLIRILREFDCLEIDANWEILLPKVYLFLRKRIASLPNHQLCSDLLTIEFAIEMSEFSSLSGKRLTSRRASLRKAGYSISQDGVLVELKTDLISHFPKVDRNRTNLLIRPVFMLVYRDSQSPDDIEFEELSVAA